MKPRSFGNVILLSTLFVTGCDRVSQHDSVTDASGTERLVLNFIGTSSGSDFHSLVWSVRRDTGWVPNVTITREAFKADRANVRWVSELHSLDAENGVAIIKVAEGDAPKNSPSVYYWRNLDAHFEAWAGWPREPTTRWLRIHRETVAQAPKRQPAAEVL